MAADHTTPPKDPEDERKKDADEVKAFVAIFIGALFGIFAIASAAKDAPNVVPFLLTAAGGAASAAATWWLWEAQQFRRALGMAGLVLVLVAGAVLSVRMDSGDDASPTTSVTEPSTVPTSLPPTGPSIDSPPPTTTVEESCEVPAGEKTLPVDVEHSFEAPHGVGGIGLATGMTSDGTDLLVTTDAPNVVGVTLTGDATGNTPSELTPAGVTWDGDSLWALVTDRFDIIRFAAGGDGTRLDSIDPESIPGLSSASDGGDLAWDGQTLWWASGNTAYRFTRDGSFLTSVPRLDEIQGIEWHDADLWLAFGDWPACSYVELTDASDADASRFRIRPITEVTALAWADNDLWVLGSEGINDARIYRVDTSAAG